ncbi:MAG: hypothetical protein RMX96_08300 [Nostoc sp. ChiSLP02]|nr:hypothetical protein [Nostoc sp. ChiSLP02]
MLHSFLYDTYLIVAKLGTFFACSGFPVSTIDAAIASDYYI